MRKTIDFNGGWRFAFGHPGDFRRDFNYGVIGKAFAKAGEDAAPLNLGFDDSAWENVTLPHDWTVSLRPVYSVTEHSKSHGYKPFGIEYPEYCIGWYRKKFFVGDEFKGKRTYFEFDGAYRSMQLFVNGIYVTRNESGYIGDRYDITEMLYSNAENVIAARLDASMPEGWFYEGCGIYRPVRLVLTDELHLLDDETFVRSTVYENDAEILIDTICENLSEKEEVYEVEALVYDGEVLVGRDYVAERVGAFKREPTMLRVELHEPKLWSPDEPYLYKVIIKAHTPDGIEDKITVETGIRTIIFDTDKGLFVNGKKTKVKGVCCHQDHAGVGSAITAPLYEYRVKKLKEFGVNAYRCSHNPPSPDLLRACDRLGLLVMDENRLLSSGPESVSQVERLVKRDRNHPSVFIWSLANEEGAIQGKETGGNMAKRVKRIFNELDGTRLTIYAGNNGDEPVGVNAVVDVRGWNYVTIGGIDAMDKTHINYPNTPILGTEEGSTVSTRNVYHENPQRGYVEAYGDCVPGWGSTPEGWWSKFAERDHLLGSFVWTGFDYRGEPTPYGWPNVTSHFGIMDMCGFPKDIYYYYKANWTDEDVLHICPHWNLDVAQGTPVKVKCFTNCESVELFLNGKPVGRADVEKYQSVYFTVPYEKGELKAVGIRNGKTVTSIVETAEKAEKYVVSSVENTVSNEKITVFTVKAEDNNGRFNASCGDMLKLSASCGEIIGVGNGDPDDHDCDLYHDRCRLYGGLLSVIVRSVVNESPELTAERK